MSRFTFYLPALVIATLLLPCKHASAIPSCSSNRPGSESHRTMYISSSKLTQTKDDERWTNALCCVYTHVEIDDESDGWMKLYDGSWEKVKGDSLMEIAQDAYSEICDMYMGSKDCQRQSDCVDQALND